MNNPQTSAAGLHGEGGPAAGIPEPTLEDWRARCLLAQSLISHRLDTTDPDVAAVLAVLRGDLSLVGA